MISGTHSTACTKPRVLVIDDDATVRRVLRAHLEGEPLRAEVTEARDGATGLSAALENEFDCVLCDINMPRLDGIAFLRVVRGQRSRLELPVLLVTSEATTADKVSAFRCGASDFVTKPFEHAELLARIETQIALARMHRQLASVADHDALTQVWNRRRLLTALETELGRSCRLGRPVSLLLLDVDHFKRVNDLYGHPTGDAVLVDLARLLTRERRAYDCLGRMGGEEFAVVLPEVDSGDAVEIADRMRSRVELASIGGLTAGEITISIGVAQAARTRDDSVAAMYSRADQRLYEAKKLGRNRVCASTRGRRCDPVVDRSSMLEPRAVPSE